MRIDDLSEPERTLWTEFPYGTHIDLSTGDPERDNPVGAQSWGPDRFVRAEVIKALLVGRRPVDEQQGREQGKGQSPSILLSGARITGRLDLGGIDFEASLLLRECALDEPLVIADSMCRSIRLYECHLPGVQGSWLRSTGDLHLRGCRINGPLDLSGAYIGGQLVFSASTFSHPGRVAVHADGLVVAGDLFCRDGTLINGEVSFMAARISGQLGLTGSTLRNPDGVALRTDRVTVEKDMNCREGFAVEGEVRLNGGHIKGQLNFNTATLHNPGGVALCADHLVVGNHLYCQDSFSADGEISLMAARIGGEVRLSAATLRNPVGTALRADRLVVAADMYCSEGFTAEGMINLTDAHINGTLSLSTARLANPGRVALLAPRLIVDRDMFCRDRLTVDGTVCLIGAHIGGKLSFTSTQLIGASLTDEQLSETSILQMLTQNAQPIEDRPVGKQFIDAPRASWRRALLVGNRRRDTWTIPTRTPPPGIVSGASGLALVADGLHVDLDMACDAGFIAYGEIRLKGARIRQNLDFSDAEIENQEGIALNAENVETERILMPAICRAGRISLRNSKTMTLDDKRGVEPDQIDITGLSYETLIPPMDPETRLLWLAKNDYEPQPYDQLGRSYRQLGYDEAARKVYLAQERRQRETLSSGRQLWGYLQDVTIGYGYRPSRAVALFILVLLVGVTGFTIFPPEPLDYSVLQPQFNPFFYTLDVLVPFADFGQRTLWSTTTGHEIFKVCLSIFGWTLGITAIAGLFRILTRS